MRPPAPPPAPCSQESLAAPQDRAVPSKPSAVGGGEGSQPAAAGRLGTGREGFVLCVVTPPEDLGPETRALASKCIRPPTWTQGAGDGLGVQPRGVGGQLSQAGTKARGQVSHPRP